MSRCVYAMDSVVLESPSTYNKSSIWVPVVSSSSCEEFLENFDLITKTIKFISRDLDKLSMDFMPKTIKNEEKTFDRLKDIVKSYNKCINTIKLLEKGTSLTQKRINKVVSHDLYQHIYQMSYSRTITPGKLNQYEPFSPQVYGETSFETINQIIDCLQLTNSDIFLDLGSGIGQVVLQIAALTDCSLSIGIEIQEQRSMYADALCTYFKRWMNFFGKRLSEIELLNGDILDEKFRLRYNKATAIFVNNVAFGSELNHKLSLIFQDLPDGVRIISPISFAKEKFRINGRNLNDISTIMDIEEIQIKGSVSWTSNEVIYYVHKMNRKKLEIFFKRSLKCKEEEEASVKSSTSSTGSVQKRVNEDLPVKKRFFKKKNDDLENQLDKFFSSCKLQFRSLIESFGSNTYRDNVLELIQQEKYKQSVLKKRIDNIQCQIDLLKIDNRKLLQQRCLELGVNGLEISSEGDFFELCRALLEQNVMFSWQKSVLAQQIFNLEQNNVNLKMEMMFKHFKEESPPLNDFQFVI